MQVENGVQLTATNPLQFKERKHVTADDTENPSIAFRILNKHRRLRLSSNELDYASFPGKTNLFAVANKKGHFLTAVNQHDSFYLVCSPLNDLQDSIESGKSPSPPFIPFPFQSQSSIKLPGTPCHVAVALNDERVLVGMLDGSVLIFDINQLLVKESQLDPVSIIPANSSFPVGNISPNRGENPELVAILRCSSNEEQGYQVEIFNVSTCKLVVTWLRGDDPNLIPVSVSWSPKGKQIAIGLQSGGFLLYNPHDPSNPKNYILKSPIVPEDSPSLLSITWIATNIFYLAFSSVESCFPSFDRSNSSSVAKTHIILAYDPKAHIGTDIEVSDPTPPFGATFPPGQLCCILKDWVPSKFLLVCGDGPSTDIGVIGSTSDENWSHYSLEETSTPALPLGEGAEDMALLGLDIDFTSKRPVRISEQPDDGTPDLPPSPILYAYMSDGSLVAWHILLLDGTPFPGMIKSVQSMDTDIATTASLSKSPSSEAALSPGDASQSAVIAPAKGFGAFSSQQASIFGSAGSTPISNSSTSPGFGSGFGNPPAPAFGVTGWGFGSQPPASATDSTVFGNTNTTTNTTTSTPVFGQTGFASFSSNAPKPSTVPSGGGFAVFAQGGTSSFGVPLGAAKGSLFNHPSAPSTQAPDSTSKPAFGFGGEASPTEPSKSTSIFPAKSPHTSIPSSILGSNPTDTVSVSSLFGTKDSGAGKASSFVTGQSDAMDIKPFDTMSSLGGSLKDAITGSPPASPTMEKSPSDSPTSETAELPKFMSPFSKVDAGSKSPPAASTDSKPMSSFIRPGFGAFGASSGTLLPPPSSVKPVEVSQSRTITETSVASSPFAPGKPVFGVSSFGTKPAFGISGFGQTPATPNKPEPAKPSAPSTGGFSSFATGGFTSFAKPAQKSSFDDLLRQGDLKTGEQTNFGAPAKPQSASIFGGISPAAPSIVTPTAEEKEKETGGEKKATPAGTTQIPESKKPLKSSATETSETANAPSARQTEAKAPAPLFEQSKTEKTAISQVEPAKSEEAKTEGPFKKDVSQPVESPSKADEISLVTTGPRPTSSFPSTGSIGTATSTTVTSGTNKSPLSIHLASSPTLVATPQSPHPSGLGIGLGRPSSRPARSSPLANTPITLGEDETAPFQALQENNITSKPAATLSPSPSQPGLFSWKPEMKNDFFKTNDTLKPPPLGTSVPAPSVSKPTSPMATANPLFGTTKSDAETVKSKQSLDTVMHPLQTEFIRIYEESCNEFRDLEKRLETLRALFPALQVPRGLDKLVKNNEDFVPGKYSFGDLDFFKTLLFRLREIVIPLLDEGKSDKLRLAELQNLALISETKREELSRWFKAKEDPDFAKTLKPKSLGPEHTENQLRLRKLLQNTLTRLQQCEDMMEALQKKLNQEKTGRGVFRAPTLDTIDRTCRNIKLALDERTEMVDRLGERMEAILPRRRSHPIDMGASLSSPSPTPFATLAVAALNSERSCLSLKSALFSARNRPLFTEKIVKAPPSAQTRPSDAFSIPSWNPSSFVHVNTPTAGTSLNSESADRRRQGRKHTSIAVPLKTSSGEETRTPAASFDWGPLPTLVSTTPKKLPFEFKTSARDAA